MDDKQLISKTITTMATKMAAVLVQSCEMQQLDAMAQGLPINCDKLATCTATQTLALLALRAGNAGSVFNGLVSRGAEATRDQMTASLELLSSVYEEVYQKYAGNGARVKIQLQFTDK